MVSKKEKELKKIVDFLVANTDHDVMTPENPEDDR